MYMCIYTSRVHVQHLHVCGAEVLTSRYCSPIRYNVQCICIYMVAEPQNFHNENTHTQTHCTPVCITA